MGRFRTKRLTNGLGEVRCVPEMTHLVGKVDVDVDIEIW